MRIGILTFHRALNYGAVLQTYALQEYLKSIGHNVKIIDYRQPYIEKIYYKANIGKYKRRNIFMIPFMVLKDILSMKHAEECKSVFEDFRKRFLNITDLPYYNSESIPKDYDAYFLGSDQIWNPLLTNGFDDVYCGFFDTIKGKKIVYAASLETKQIKKEQYNNVRKFLANFDYLSLREKSAQQLLSSFTDKEINVVLDPTLLVEKNIWDGLLEKNYALYDYILIYQVRIIPDTYKIAKKLSHKYNLRVIQLSSEINKNDDIRPYPSPNRFLTLLKNARYVITTSFHATVFSLLFEKDFYVAKSKNKENDRVISLLNNFNLLSRYVDFDTFEEKETINYDAVSQHLEIMRKGSINYISNALQSCFQ